MIYFVNKFFTRFSTSIGKTEINRINIFKKMNVPAKIVTCDFNSMMDENIKSLGLQSTDMLNMYDYFRDTLDMPEQVLKSSDLVISKDYDIKVGADISYVTDGIRDVMKIHHVPRQYGHVHFIEYLDYVGNLVKRRDYDSRGFLVRDQFFSREAELINEVHYDKNGREKITNYFDSNNYIIRTVLHNYKNKTLYFENEIELASFFLDELNREDNCQATFIGDNPSVSYEMIMGMKTRGKNILYMPTVYNVAYKNGFEIDNRYLYAGAFKNIEKWDKVIVATEEQKLDLIQSFKGRFPIEIDVISPYLQVELDISKLNRKKNKIVYTGKIDSKNNVLALVKAFAKVLPILPNATLDIYGYGTECNNLKSEIENLKLDNCINLLGYQTDISSAYKESELLVYTGITDVAPLGIIEAMSYGIPCIVCKDNYGVRNIVRNFENGILVDSDNINKISSAIVNVLKNKKRLHKMSQLSYETACEYSLNIMTKKWKEILTMN